MVTFSSADATGVSVKLADKLADSEASIPESAWDTGPWAVERDERAAWAEERGGEPARLACLRPACPRGGCDEG